VGVRYPRSMTLRRALVRSLPWRVVCAVAVAQSVAVAGRFETFTEKAAQGPKMRVVAATYFGGEGIEDFVGAGGLPDGTIVAFGNAWGPHFPAAAAPLVLGRGTHHKLNPYLPDPIQKKTSPATLREDDPDEAGMLVFYGGRLESVKKVVRFDWGVAGISCGVISRDGAALYIAGRCTSAFATAARSGLKTEPPTGDKGTGPYEYGGVPCTGDVYLAKLPASGDGVLWAIVFQGARTSPDRLWLDYEDNVYADVHGLVRVTPDGRRVNRIDVLSSSAQNERRTLTATRSAHYLAIDPKDGSFFYGGDRSTNTGSQPWLQPYLYRYDADGRRTAKLWDWTPKLCACGDDGNGLCADSSPRLMDIAPDGTLVIGAWSDGGNSVFTRQPTELDQPSRFRGFGMDSSGTKEVTSIAYILKIDPDSLKQTSGTLFQAYVPTSSKDSRKRGAPSSTKIQHLAVAESGAIAFTGTAASGLVQTPGAFYKYPDDASGSDGEYVAVFSGDFQALLFSSYLPGCEHANVVTFGKNVIVTSRSKGTDGKARPTASPAFNAIQPQKKGELDAHILLLAEPQVQSEK